MKKKNKTRSVTGLLFGFMERVSGDHVGAYATQAAYFLIMSFIPCILFLTTLVRYTPLTYNVVRDAIVAFIPENLQSFVLGIVVDVYKRSTAIVPLSAIVALWSAGKGMQSIINGLNTIYHVKETRNWLLTRIYAVFYTLSLVIAVIVSLLMLVLGNEYRKLYQDIFLFLEEFWEKYWGQEHCWYLVCCFWFFLCCIRFFRTEKPHSKARFPEP
jgi:Predicted membrane protein